MRSESPNLSGRTGTPLAWRTVILAGVVLLGTFAWYARDGLGSAGQAACGVACFLGVAAAFSADLRLVRPRIVLLGLVLQVGLALVLKTDYGYQVFRAIGEVVSAFVGFSQKGAEFVFGSLANRDDMTRAFGPDSDFVFVFMALPSILFVSAIFSVLYYLGVMQLVVGAMAWVMRRTMGTGGAESLSAAANVFMGQTEAPLLVRPYVRRMSRSQLMALMVGGMATVSGGMLAVYTQIGADPVALLTTSVMAAPASLYVAKILVPDVGAVTDPTRPLGPVTDPRKSRDRPATGVIDALAKGTLDGLKLALNVAAMLIVFLALIAMINALLGSVGLMSLEAILGRLFGPVACLIGVQGDDIPKVGELLGIKLVANEMVAFLSLGDQGLSARSTMLATFALTGFANFSSVGIQIGGIGAMAPRRRSVLAKLGMRALLGGFLATLINAAIAAILL